jgi:hypothetical protein
MPEKGKTGDNSHQVDENHRRNTDGSRTGRHLRVKSHEVGHKPKHFEKIEELVKEARLTETVHFRDILAACQIRGNACLIFGGGLKGKSFINILRSF